MPLLAQPVGNEWAFGDQYMEVSSCGPEPGWGSKILCAKAIASLLNPHPKSENTFSIDI